MADFFIKRPIFAIVISIIIVLIGLASAVSLPIAQYPQISPPIINVSTSYTGANADVVNETVAQVIEQQINGVQGMDYMSSSSDNNGDYNLDVTFELGTDGDMDAVKVQNNAAIANASLPTDVKETGVTTKKSSEDMALMAFFYSPNGTYDSVFIKNYMDIYLMDRIKRVKGVGDVTVFGSDYSMRVWLNPDKLAERGLSISDVISAIQDQNTQAPAGTIGQLPAPDTQEKQFTGKTKGRLSKPEEFGNIILKTGKPGQFTRLKDVARIETGSRQNTYASSFNGHPGIGIGIQLTNDANTLETVTEVKKIMAEAAKSFPADLTYDINVDNTSYIHASIEEVEKTFVEALILVILIVFLFLQSWRATLIPLLAVPVSLIGTFASFVVLNFTINTLTLFGMVLAIGLVVDDAIVVIENVESHMEKDGLSPREATKKAMKEVQGPIVAIAAVLCAIFVPAAFLGGMTGVLYRQFALTIAISVSLSAFVALSLTPALCALILRPPSKDRKKGKLAAFFDPFNRGYERMQNSYEGMTGKILRHLKYPILVLITVVCLTGFFYHVLPSTFVPDEDQGYFTVSVNMPEGTSLNKTDETVRAVSEEVRSIPGVKDAMGISGFDVMSNSAKSSAGSIFVGLTDWSERKSKEKSLDRIISKTNELSGSSHPEAKITAFNSPALPGLGSVGGWTLELQDNGGHSDKELETLARSIVEKAGARKELSNVTTTFSVNTPDYEFDVDRDKVKSLGLNLKDVFTAMQVNYGGYEVNDFNRFGRTYKVVLQADSSYRSSADTTRFIYVKSDTGDMVPLSTLLMKKAGTSPAMITRFNSKRSIQFMGGAGDGYSSGQAMKAIEEVVKENAPEGYTIDWSGQSREEKKAGNTTFQVLGLALVFVFLCLAALYESWSVPFAVLFTVPCGILGALFSEWFMGRAESFFGYYNAGLQSSVYMQIGIIMIIGLAAKNAILIVEFAKVRYDGGMKLMDAAIEAARLRLRPILMTSLAFIIGCLPLAAAEGAGSASRSGMGVAVVGGMLSATILGAFLIPAFYVITVKAAQRLYRIRNHYVK